jgi:hypothetical protein
MRKREKEKERKRVSHAAQTRGKMLQAEKQQDVNQKGERMPLQTRNTIKMPERKM